MVVQLVQEARLRFHLGPQGAVWYHRAAGRNHVLIDPQAPARALAPGFVRPIELWRAPRWQRPPSAAVVRYAAAGAEPAAEFGADEPPALGDVVNRASVVDFVGDISAFRLGALGALIDSVAAALDGGPPVVVAVERPDEAALWIGAVSFFAPPAVSLQISFSTAETWDDVSARLARERAGGGGHQSDQNSTDPGWRTPVISAVPRAQVQHLTRQHELPAVVIDPRVEATLGAAAGREHRQTQLGQRIAVTDWSRLALDACCEDFSALERCLTRLDEAAGPGPATGDEADWWPTEAARPAPSAGPAWSLAAAVALSGDLPLALPTATRVLLRDTPSSVRLPAELAARVTSLVTATVDDAEQAWARLAAAQAADPVRATLVQAAFESYLRLACADDAWLLGEAAPLPPGPAPDPALAGRLRAPLAAMVERLSGGDDLCADVRAGVLALRAVDFAVRAARLLGGPDPALVGLGRLGARAAELLLEPDLGERVAEVVGPLDPGGLARWVIPPIEQAAAVWTDAPAGRRLPAPVTALLAAAVDVDRLVALARPEALGGQPVALEVAVASARGRIVGDRRLRGPAVEYLLAEAAASYPDADPAALVAEVFADLPEGEPWPAAALLRVVQRAPAALAAELVPLALRWLPDWADDPDSGRLAAALLKRIEFLPRLGGDGRPRPRRAGTSDHDAQLLNLLAATGEGWLRLDDGLHRRAAEILMWADRAWPGIEPRVRRLIAPRIAVAAFQVALAAEPDQASTVLRSRLGVVPVGAAWRAAVPLGLEQALPLVGEVLALNRYRLAGELVLASTRAMLAPGLVGEQLGHQPRLPLLPVGPVILRLVTAEPSGQLLEHLAALVEQELREHERRTGGRVDRPRLLAFWERALPGAPLRPAEPPLADWPAVVGGHALQVALGAGTRPAVTAGLAQLLADPPRRANGPVALDPPDRAGRAGWPGLDLVPLIDPARPGRTTGGAHRRSLLRRLLDWVTR